MNARLCISGSLVAALLIGGVTLAVHLDDSAVFWERGVGQITRHLNAYFQKNHQGRVVFACSGRFPDVLLRSAKSG